MVCAITKPAGVSLMEVECKIAPVEQIHTPRLVLTMLPDALKDRLLNFGRSCRSVYAKGLRRRACAYFSEVVTQIQLVSSRMDSMVRILHAQPRSRCSNCNSGKSGSRIGSSSNTSTAQVASGLVTLSLLAGACLSRPCFTWWFV